MTLSQMLYLILIGLLAGFASGMLGIGGAIILIPGMVFLLGMSQQTAQGTSLAVMLLPIGILATLNYYKKGYVNFYFALVLIITFIVGSYFGSLLVVNMPEKILRKIFAVLLFIVGIQMFLKK